MRTMIALVMVAASWTLPSGAQTSTYAEAGGSRVTYGDTVEVTAGTLSGAVNALTRNTSFSGLLAGSATQSSSWTIFGAADGSVLTPGFYGLRGELNASGSGTTYGSNTGSAQVLGGARLHLSGQRVGTWVGVSAGRVIDPVGARGIRMGAAAVWAQFGPSVAQVSVMPARIADGPDYTDTEAVFRFGGARFELGAVGGFRSEIVGYEDSPRSWASVNVTAWVLQAVGITGAAGSYPADVGQGLPSAKYVSLGVRLASRRAIPPLRELPSDPILLGRGPVAPDLKLSAEVNGSRTITFRAPSAGRVEIMGDFTDWTPVQMRAGDASGTWAVTLPVSSGVHQVNVRIDGGEWSVPAGLTTIRDEFGGSVGVLVVPLNWM